MAPVAAPKPKKAAAPAAVVEEITPEEVIIEEVVPEPQHGNGGHGMTFVLDRMYEAAAAAAESGDDDGDDEDEDGGSDGGSDEDEDAEGEYMLESTDEELVTAVGQLTQLMMTEEGEAVTDVLNGIRDALTKQNKILYRGLQLLESRGKR
jgi:hypothetical protein